MNLYQHLMQHLERHVYKRGTNKGAAPANKGQRWRSNFLVVKHADYMAVRLWRTDIIKAYPDGTFIIDTEGYYSYPTTTVRMNEALNYFVSSFMWMGSIKKFSLSQKIMYVRGTRYRFYDGMKFDADCNLLTESKCFERRCVNKNETKAFMEDVKASGFREVFNVLWSQVKSEDRWGVSTYRLHEIITDPDKSEEWANIIAYFSFETRYHSQDIKVSPTIAWSRIMQACKKDMYVVVPTTIHQA